MPTHQEEIERLAALALAPLIEVAWADGHVTPGERQGVIEAAKNFGLYQQSAFCRSTLSRWLTEPPPTEALQRWRDLLGLTLARTRSRTARKSERALIEEARRIAKMDEPLFGENAVLDASAGITAEEQRVLDELGKALASLVMDD